MVFSSPVFLFLFLPLTLLGYHLLPLKLRNTWLLFTSLVFFAWGGVSYTVILIGSITVNYIFGLLIFRNLHRRRAWYWLCAGVTVNLTLLVIFKYANFLTASLDQLFSSFSALSVAHTDILLPIGISFYTFHAISYLVDIYRQKCAAQKNILDLSLYVAMFSQLVAGPIIRYSDVWSQLRSRRHDLAKFSAGIERFLVGLGKKVLLANTFGAAADSIFKLPPGDAGTMTAWLGMISYTLQIYCDFSGYSDMAIGLGKMFGFTFLENFNFPYIAASVKEFWRRWHISLSSFFRDYVYIPLGGNRSGKSRQYHNLVLVFFLTGFWHGAGWTFIAWGTFHGLFLLMETAFLGNWLSRLWKPIGIAYTLLVAMFAWVLFRADTLAFALDYWQQLLNFKTNNDQRFLFYSYLNLEYLTALLICLLGSFGVLRRLGEAVQPWLLSMRKRNIFFSYTWHLCSAVVYAAIFLLSTAYLVAGTYNPFIYYRF